jgi:hypothetical protein
MRTKRLIQAAKLALVFLFVGCSSSGDSSTGQTAAAELGIGGGGWSSSAGHAGSGDQGGQSGFAGATVPTTEHPGSNPGSAGAGNAGAHDPGAGGNSGGKTTGSPCSFFGSIFKCPGKSSTPTPGGSTGGAGHTGSGARTGTGTPETGGGASGGAGGGAGGGAVIPRIL